LFPLGAAVPDAVTIAIISDTHGYLDHRIAEVISNCDLAIHAGDIGNNAVLQQMTPRSGRVFYVQGNNDTPARWPEAEHPVLAALCEQQTLQLPGGAIAVEHGHRVWDTHRYHQRLRKRHPHARAIVYGHTHRRVCDTQEVPWVINPGAAGRNRTFGGPSCLVLTVAGDKWRVRKCCFDPMPRGSKRRTRNGAMLKNAALTG